jgi:hypothetical protein
MIGAMRMRRVVLSLAVLVAGLVPVGAEAQAATIQPGDFMGSSIGGCTLGFVFDATNSSDVYVGTAAHCTSGVGDPIRLQDGTIFGDTAVSGNPNVTEDDWALIRVRPGFVSQVRPNVRGVESAPTGVATPSQTNTLDLLRVSGHGALPPYNLLPLTREQRVGLQVTHDSDTYTAIALDTFGDSGGPIVHASSNRAFGVVSRLCVGACTSEGPTIQGMISRAGARGFPISLRTV